MRRMKTFRRICKQTQKELIPYLVSALQHDGYEVSQGDGYVYAKGEVPVLLTAHMDTVHKEPMKHFCVRTIEGQHHIGSPQGIGGDDRCGIYMILEIIKNFKCSVLFCEDEEIGRVGSRKFCKTEHIKDLSDLNYLIELDRAYSKDAVFYSCDNPKFTEFITKNTGYTKAWGSYSDISTLMPECKIAGVNLSCGYYRAHTTSEYVIWEEMLNTIEVVKKLLTIECTEQFEYIEGYSYSNYYGRGEHYGGGGYYGRYSGGYCAGYYNSGYDDDDDYYLSGYHSPRTYYNSRIDRTLTANSNHGNNNIATNKTYDCVLLTIEFLEDSPTADGIKTTKTKYISAKTTKEAWGIFFTKYPSVCYNDVLDFEVDWC